MAEQRNTTSESPTLKKVAQNLAEMQRDAELAGMMQRARTKTLTRAIIMVAIIGIIIYLYIHNSKSWGQPPSNPSQSYFPEITTESLLDVGKYLGVSAVALILTYFLRRANNAYEEEEALRQEREVEEKKHLQQEGASKDKQS